jgi:RNA:NAD 2'-phosphotransferase (TPT1/KptA family)
MHSNTRQLSTPLVGNATDSMLLGKLGTHLRVLPTHSPFFTTIRTYGKRKTVWVLNKQGRKLQVDIRDAGKAKYQYLYPKKSQLSNTISWLLLRHGAKSEGLDMRPDGYVRVTDLVSPDRNDIPCTICQCFKPKMRAPKLANSLDFPALKEIVQSDSKRRYTFLYEPDPTSGSNEAIWWIRATDQGHSIKV